MAYSGAPKRLRFDPAFEKISRRFLDDSQAFAEAFARAGFKPTHRDIGPKARYLGPEVPKEALICQDPLPTATLPAPGAADLADVKANISASDLTVAQFVSTAWRRRTDGTPTRRAGWRVGWLVDPAAREEADGRVA